MYIKFAFWRFIAPFRIITKFKKYLNFQQVIKMTLLPKKLLHVQSEKKINQNKMYRLRFIYLLFLSNSITLNDIAKTFFYQPINNARYRCDAFPLPSSFRGMHQFVNERREIRFFFSIRFEHGWPILGRSMPRRHLIAAPLNQPPSQPLPPPSPPRRWLGPVADDVITRASG